LWFLFCRHRCGVFEPFFDRWQTRRKRLQNKNHNLSTRVRVNFLSVALRIWNSQILVARLQFGSPIDAAKSAPDGAMINLNFEQSQFSLLHNSALADPHHCPALGVQPRALSPVMSHRHPSRNTTPLQFHAPSPTLCFSTHQPRCWTSQNLRMLRPTINVAAPHSCPGGSADLPLPSLVTRLSV
jgi:hypothetical protein